MARILDIYPRNVFASLEFNIDELKQLKWFMDHCSVDFRGDNPEEKAAVDYVTEKFCPMIRDVLNQVDGG